MPDMLAFLYCVFVLVPNPCGSIQLTKQFDGFNIYEFEMSEVLNSTFMVNAFGSLPILFNHSFNDIGNYPDMATAAQFKQSTPSRFRKIRFIDGVQKICNIDRENNQFGYNELKVNVTSRTAFIQTVPSMLNDYRIRARHYDLIETDIVQSDIFLDYMNYISLFAASEKMHNYAYDKANINMNEDGQDCFEYEFELSLHFIRNKVSPSSRSASNSPEGIHQDGDCFTVIGPVINRYNIAGGYNVMYDLNKSELSRFVINEGEGVMFDDHSYFHHITKIKYKPNNNPLDLVGYRDIVLVGFSFKSSLLNRWKIDKSSI
eukprot:2847_1